MTAKSRMTEMAKDYTEQALTAICATYEPDEAYSGLSWVDMVRHKLIDELRDFENGNDKNRKAYQEMVLKSVTKLTAKDMAPIISFFVLAQEAIHEIAYKNNYLKDRLKDLDELTKQSLKLEELVKNHNINTELPEEDLTERGQEDGRIEAKDTKGAWDVRLDMEWNEEKKIDNFNESLKSEPKRTYGDYQHLLEEHTKLKYKLIRLSVLLDEQLPHLETVQTEMEEMRNDLNILTQANRRVDKQSSAT